MSGIVLNIAVCDDETIYCDKITAYITDYCQRQNISVHIESFSSGDAFVAIGERMGSYDIVYLDLNMSGLSGLETAEKLRLWCRDTYLVFVTAYLDFALAGYRYDAVRCVMKNEETLRDGIEESLQAVLKKMDLKVCTREYQFRESSCRIADMDLVMAESKLHDVYVTVRTRTGWKTYTMTANLNDVEQMLSDSKAPFLRIQQSYLVNLAYVKKVIYCEIIMDNGLRISISRHKYQDVKKRFLLYKGEL